MIPLDINDARTFLKAADEHWLAALWLILVTTGLRRGEALGLTWADIDLGRGTLHVRRTIQKINGRFLYGEPKSRRSSERSGFPPAASPPSTGSRGSPLTGPTWSAGRRSRTNPPTSSS